MTAMTAAAMTGEVSRAAQIAQQSLQKAEATPKPGGSKFDAALAERADAAQAMGHAGSVQATLQAHAVQQAHAAHKAQPTNPVQKAGKLDEPQKVRSLHQDDPIQHTEATRSPRVIIEQLLTELESRTVEMNTFINKAIHGHLKLSPQQLLGLQAKVSEYSLEVDLTGKVVEKATSGLKETLKTQV